MSSNESQDFGNFTDGMGFLTVDPRRAGYTGPQSGIAALKFLQYLPLYIPLSSFIPTFSSWLLSLLGWWLWLFLRIVD